MKLKLFYLLLFSLIVSATTFGQNSALEPCGTQDGKSPWLRAYQQDPMGFPRNEDTLYVPLTIHIVGTSQGSGHFPARKVLEAFCTLNNDFAPSAIQFFIEGEFNYLNNTNWYDHGWSQGGQMMNFNQVSNSINCYIVEDPAGNCGYSSYNRGIALAKSCMDPTDHTWSHEIGHYLSLPHPFSGWEGYEHHYNDPAPFNINGHPVERVNNENCHVAGDGFCDTPPDYLNSRWNCNSEGVSSRIQKDPYGVDFQSDGTLIMSYSNDDCANRFSDDQISAMRANLLTEKSSYLYNQTPLNAIVLNPLVAISPLENEIVPNYQSVTFAWNPVENATHYLLEISPTPFFGNVQGRYEVEGTTYTSQDLDPDRKYYWRVMPYNRLHGCTAYLNGPRFETSSLTAVESIPALTDLQLLPNPSLTGQVVQVVINATERLNLNVQITTLTGQILQQDQWAIGTGVNYQALNLEQAPAGIYLLKLQSDQGVVTKRVLRN